MNIYFYRSIDCIYTMWTLEHCNEAKARLNWDWYEVLQLIDSWYYELRDKILKDYDSLTDLDIRDIWIKKDKYQVQRYLVG